MMEKHKKRIASMQEGRKEGRKGIESTIEIRVS